MAVVITQESPQALKSFQIDISNDKLLSGEQLIVRPPEEVVNGEELELPRLTVCQPSNIDWKQLDCSNCEYSRNDLPMEHCVSEETSRHMYNVASSLCVSTPDINQTDDRMNGQLSNQAVPCVQSKNNLIKHHRRSITHTSMCRLVSRSQLGLNHSRSKSLNSEQVERQIYKRIAHDFEKDLTFRPQLNEHSVKLAARHTRNSVSVVHRLLEAKKNLPDPYDQRLTFAPKLNPTSLRMAQERAAKMPEVC